MTPGCLYDMASLIEIVRRSEGRFCKAYVILGGPGFSHRARGFLLRQVHREVFTEGHLVEVVSLEEFLAVLQEPLSEVGQLVRGEESVMGQAQPPGPGPGALAVHQPDENPLYCQRRVSRDIIKSRKSF